MPLPRKRSRERQTASDLLYQALEEPLGLIVTTRVEQVHFLTRRLNQVLREEGLMDSLAVRCSKHIAGEIWLVNKLGEVNGA